MKADRIKIVLDGLCRRELTDEERDAIYDAFDKTLIEVQNMFEDITFTEYNLFVNDLLLEGACSDG